jgi:hypothetical protein
MPRLRSKPANAFRFFSIFRMRRTFRRLFIAVPVIAAAIFSGTYLKDVVRDNLHPQMPEVVVVTEAPTTVTRTVYVPVTPMPAPPAQVHDDDLQPHEYRPDGLLEVNPNGPHPIFELMKRGEADWRAKLGRASKTLDEAVAEYERRYGRMPPRGKHSLDTHTHRLTQKYFPLTRTGFEDWCVLSSACFECPCVDFVFSLEVVLRRKPQCPAPR